MSRLLRLLAIAAGVIVFAVIVSSVGVATISDMLRRVGWRFAAVSVLYGVHIAVRAFALWRSLPRPFLPYRDVLRVRLSGEAVEMLTFTGPFLAEPAKALLLAERGLSGPEAFGGVAIEYLLYTVVSSWMATAALVVLIARGVLPAGMQGATFGLIAGIAVFTIGFAFAAVSGIGLIVPALRAAGAVVGRDRAARIAARVGPVEDVLIGFMHGRPGRLMEVLGIEAAGHLLLALEILVVVQALALDARASDPFVIEGGVKFISAVFFFVPGQLGASESVYAWLFGLLGLTAAAGLTMALVRRIRALIIAGVGLAVLAAGRWAGPPSSARA